MAVSRSQTVWSTTPTRSAIAGNAVFVDIHPQRLDRRVGPGPRRGHTAARAFQISPVQFASDAITYSRRREATVDQLAGPIAILVIR